MDLVIRILCIAALVVVLCGGMLFIGSLAVLVTILLGVLMYYFVFPKLDVEYEYTLLNHDLEIDAIYSKSKRKKLMTLDIQQAEIIAPKNSHRLDSVHADKTKDFSAGTGEGTYAIVIPRSGIAFTVSGTIAAVGPILVPIINFVTGIIATRSTTNGVLLTMFIITLIMLYTTAFGYRPPFLVNIRTTARINAITVAIISDIPTMYSVSANDVSSFSFDIPKKFSSAIFFPSF